MSFPSSIPSYQGYVASETLSAANNAAQLNQMQSDTIGLATKLGTGSSTPTSTSVLVGNGVGTSTWGQVSLSTSVSGLLPTTNGGTGTTSTTGTGSVVFNTSPSLTTPTVTGGTFSSPTITTPAITYSNNSIPAAAIVNNSLNSNQFQAGGINFVDLLSTIFSGQLQSQANAGTAGGTMYYINLGGIKLLWGQTGGLSGSTSPTAAGVTFPAFFTTVQSAVANANTINTVSQQSINIGALSTSGLSIFVWAQSTTSAENIGYFVIGT